GPTGIVGVLHDACQRASLPSASLWAAVPHYVAAAPNPKAALALVRRVEGLAGVAVDGTALEEATEDYERQVNAAVASDPDVEALSAGARLPLRDSFCIHMANDAAPALTGKASRDAVYKTLDLRKTARIESYVAAPLELSDGTRVASVCAMSSEKDLYSEEHR